MCSKHYTEWFQLNVVCWEEGVNIGLSTSMQAHFNCSLTLLVHSTPSLQIHKYMYHTVRLEFPQKLQIIILLIPICITSQNMCVYCFFKHYAAPTSILNPMKTILSGHFAIWGRLFLWLFDFHFFRVGVGVGWGVRGIICLPGKGLMGSRSMWIWLVCFSMGGGYSFWTWTWTWKPLPLLW